MTYRKKLLAVLVSLVMAMSLCVPAFAAPEDETTTTARTTTTRLTTSADTSDEAIARATAEGEDTEEEEDRSVDEIITSYNNHNGRVLSVANAGYPRLYPEDSLTGLRYCVENGIDIVAVSVQKTKDGGLVLLEDETMSRMLVDRTDGNSAKGKVKDYTLEELQNNFYLRDGHGGENRKTTKETVPGLHDALELTRNSVMLYIRNGFQYAETINDVAKGLNACDVVILGGAASADDIRNFVKQTGTPICHITANFVDGTTEGAPRNYVKDTLDAGADAVRLVTEKDYSSIFKSATMKHFTDAGRAMADATTFATSGEHVDRIEGWQELVEAGYSIIETDYPKELSAYIKDIESYRTELSSLITQAQTLNTDDYSKETAKSLKKALEKAEEVSSRGAISLREIDETRYDLQESIDALEMGQEVDAAHMPVWKIVLIIVIILLAIAAIAVIALRLFNKHKTSYRKQKKIRRKYKAMSEKNLEEAETELTDDITPISQDTASLNVYETFSGDGSRTERRTPPASRPAPTPAPKPAQKPAPKPAPVEEPVSAESITEDFEKMLEELKNIRGDD